MRQAAVFVRAAALSLLALALPGCFFSEEEVIGYWGADRPFQTGEWAHWPTHPDGSEWERETWRGAVELQRRRYRSAIADFPHEGARFKQLHENTYLAQIPRDGGVGYGVAWVYENGQVVSYHQPDCGALSDAMIAEAGLTRDPEGFCTILDLEQLEAIMRVYLDVAGDAISVDGVYRRVG